MADCGRNWDVRTDVYNRKTPCQISGESVAPCESCYVIRTDWRSGVKRRHFLDFVAALKVSSFENAGHRQWSSCVCAALHRSALFLVFLFYPPCCFLSSLIFFVYSLFFFLVFFLLPLLSPACHSSHFFTSANLTNSAACFRRVFLAMPPFSVDVMTLPSRVLQPPTQAHQWLRLVPCKEPIKFETVARLLFKSVYVVNIWDSDTAGIFRRGALKARLCSFFNPLNTVIQVLYHLHLSGKT